MFFLVQVKCNQDFHQEMLIQNTINVILLTYLSNFAFRFFHDFLNSAYRTW